MNEYNIFTLPLLRCLVQWNSPEPKIYIRPNQYSKLSCAVPFSPATQDVSIKFPANLRGILSAKVMYIQSTKAWSSLEAIFKSKEWHVCLKTSVECKMNSTANTQRLQRQYLLSNIQQMFPHEQHSKSRWQSENPTGLTCRHAGVKERDKSSDNLCKTLIYHNARTRGNKTNKTRFTCLNKPWLIWLRLAFMCN